MEAVCHVVPQARNGVTGFVHFKQASRHDAVNIHVNLRNFPKDGLFGFHIHRFGNMTEGCGSMCEHFDANRGRDHGAPTDSNRHIGDLGNIRVRNRVCKATFTDSIISLFGNAGKRSIVGRGVVVHEREDDLGRGGDEESLITGNAGKRVACGVIGLASDLY